MIFAAGPKEKWPGRHWWKTATMGVDDISDPRQQRVPDIAPSASADRGHRGSASIRCTFLEYWARPQRRHALRGVPKRSSSHGKELEEDSLERRSRSPHNLFLMVPSCLRTGPRHSVDMPRAQGAYTSMSAAWNMFRGLHKPMNRRSRGCVHNPRKLRQRTVDKGGKLQTGAAAVDKET
jgi:hypothetical protein